MSENSLLFPFTLTKSFAYRASQGVLSIFGLLYVPLKINSMMLSKLRLLFNEDEFLFSISSSFNIILKLPYLERP